jgi:hypothetical protein
MAERQAMQRSRKATDRPATPDARKRRGDGGRSSNGKQGARTS